jgi:hypothetical protein
VAHPVQLMMPEEVLEESFSSDWPRRYARLDVQLAKQWMKDVVIERRIVNNAKGDASLIAGSDKDVTVEEEFTIKQAQTPLGPLTVSRSIRYAANAGWMPCRIQRTLNGHVDVIYDFEWKKVQPSRDVAEAWFPYKTRIRRYALKQLKADAEDVLFNSQSMEIDLSSIKAGAAVEKMETKVEIPQDAKVIHLGERPATSQSSTSRAALGNPLFIMSILIVLVTTARSLNRRVRRQSIR